VPEVFCKTCDSEGHHLGEVWHPDKCTTCNCTGTVEKISSYSSCLDDNCKF